MLAGKDFQRDIPCQEKKKKWTLLLSKSLKNIFLLGKVKKRKCQPTQGQTDIAQKEIQKTHFEKYWVINNKYEDYLYYFNLPITSINAALLKIKPLPHWTYENILLKHSHSLNDYRQDFKFHQKEDQNTFWLYWQIVIVLEYNVPLSCSWKFS